MIFSLLQGGVFSNSMLVFWGVTQYIVPGSCVSSQKKTIVCVCVMVMVATLISCSLEMILKKAPKYVLLTAILQGNVGNPSKQNGGGAIQFLAETNSKSTRKWMVGRLWFLFGMAYSQWRAVTFHGVLRKHLITPVGQLAQLCLVDLHLNGTSSDVEHLVTAESVVASKGGAAPAKPLGKPTQENESKICKNSKMISKWYWNQLASTCFHATSFDFVFGRWSWELKI